MFADVAVRPPQFGTTRRFTGSHSLIIHSRRRNRTVFWATIGLLLGHSIVRAGSTDIANVPMAVSTTVTPNVLLMLDNSQSMDAYMNGIMVSGNNPLTRGNIGRSVMRSAVTTYRSAFNWGLMSYGLTTNPPAINSTYGYFMGSNTGMLFTNDCTGYVAGAFNGAPAVAGVSAAGGKRCIANPQPLAGGGNFITFDLASDNSDIVDLLYFGAYQPAGVPMYSQIWARALDTATPTSYAFNQNHNTAVATWNAADFGSFLFNTTFSATDAGFLPSNSGAVLPNNVSRILFTPRGWGYNSSVTGAGKVMLPAAADSVAQYAGLQALLGNETSDTGTTEIKNGAVFTTLKGTLDTAKSYYAGTLAGTTSPVSQTCQQNFVMMVTDGLPTGTTGGSLYSAADRTNSCNWSTVTNSCTSGSFGTAVNDVRTSINALRTTAVVGRTSKLKDGTGAVTGLYDIQTYVVALGETVANANALSAMNAMAFGGGTDKSLAATDGVALEGAIRAITDDITARVGASAAVAVANAHVTSTDNASFASSYNSGTWSGDINSFAIDVTTGVPSATSLWTSGSASTQVDLRNVASRFVATSVDTEGAIGGKQFQPTSAATATKLSAAQQTLLNTPSTTDGAAVLAYLRGDRTGETAGTYRPRAHVLGDMINSEPVLVRAPSAAYADAGYTSFKVAQASRTRMLFQGANDGMLHAFDATTGAESWAYVPNLVMANLNNLSSKTAFTHIFYVDGTPVAGDVDFSNMSSKNNGNLAPDWHTVLAGGLGKGGRGYYALDVTTTTASSEVALQNKVLWEFPNSVTDNTARAASKLNMGYSYGKPIVVKTKAEGWVVLVTSGYNNGTNAGDSGGDGRGHLFVLDPKTGDLIKDIVTPATCAGSPTSNPCGFAQISAYVANDVDNTAEYVYGGDLKGNVWRFDLTSSSKSGWSVALFASLVDAGGVAQPVTTAPELALVSGYRMVFVGTGQYLGTTDVPLSASANANAGQTQTMYGLRDQLASLPTPLRSNLQQQTLTTSGVTRNLSSNLVDYGTKSGWYVDMPTLGERLNTDPVVALGALIFTSNIPSATVCEPGGSSWEYFVNLKTGGLVEYSTVSWSGTYLGNALASRPVLVQLPSGKVVSLVRLSDAKTLEKDVPVSPPGAGARRISWRELFN